MPYLLLILVLLVAGWAFSTYNNFVSLSERVDNAKAQIATQIESRWEAVKSLIDATKNYSKHEAELLGEVTLSRTSLGREASVADIERDSTQLDNLLSRLIAVSENYPDLKASQVYETTMEKIDKHENNVRQSRMIYNDTVTKYNRYLKVFPSSILGKLMGFSPKDYFQGSQDKDQMPSWS